MSVRSQALVPLSTEQQAAWRAVAETEKRRHQGNTLAEYPYAGAFFRCLNGSRRISLSVLSPVRRNFVRRLQPDTATAVRTAAGDRISGWPNAAVMKKPWLKQNQTN